MLFPTSGTPTKGLFGNRYKNALFMSIYAWSKMVNYSGSYSRKGYYQLIAMLVVYVQVEYMPEVAYNMYSIVSSC